MSATSGCTAATSARAYGVEPRAVIEVRVGQGDDVDAPRPGREAGAELGQEACGIRTAVDERDLPGDLDEERVALADVEGPDPEGRGRRRQQTAADRRG